ncbi:MAG: hypothetical protein V1706_02990 [Pseudomonadota bacterium]
MTDHLSASRINHVTLLLWFLVSVISPAPLCAQTNFAGNHPSDEVSNNPPPEPHYRLIMPDGQLISRPIQVFVPNQKITFNDNPSLCLIRSGNSIQYVAGNNSQCFGGLRKPFEVAPNQEWRIQGETYQTLFGTLLFFDLGDLTVPNFRPSICVLPSVRWKKGDTFIAFSDQKVYLADRIHTTVWTMSILFILLFLLHLLTRKSEGGLLSLITTEDKALSVSLAQVALWTMAVGGIVLGYGFMRREVPDIPDTLLMLMGFSVITGTVGQWQTQQQRFKKFGKLKAEWSDLVMDHTPQGPQTSLAKAQMLFWTIISIILFVVKSILDGIIWDVPTQLVLLMGISQGSYMSLKQIAGTKKIPEPPKASKPAPHSKKDENSGGNDEKNESSRPSAG